MHLTLTNQELFDEYAKDIVSHPLFNETKKVFSHGAVTIYDHCINVAKLSFYLAEKTKSSKSLDKKCIVRAALLHDFFLYEWHIWGMRYILHGWVHSKIAAQKAREVFGISCKEYSCIRNHMWPWTLFNFPKSREGWIISLSDKIVALREIALHRGKRRTLQDPNCQ